MDTRVRRRRRNRSWPEALKREIVAASLTPGTSVSLVARRYDVNTNQLFSWRKLYRDELGGSLVDRGPAMVPVAITADAAEARGVETVPALAANGIEIVLEGCRVRVGGAFDARALARVLDVLERR